MLLFAVFLVSSLFSASLAEFSFGKSCPDISGKIIDVPDLHPYMGRWYEIKRYSTYFERGIDCNYAFYTFETSPNDNDYIQVNNTGYKDGVYTSIVGKATQPYPPKGAFIVSFPVNPIVPSYPNYNIMALNTSSYVLIYNCRDVGIAPLNGVFEISWILAREPSLSDDVIQMLYGVADSLGIDTKLFQSTNQQNCP
ncbi:apolipoprotein D-like [Symsagittifera roscoffensis]|uniref:apolipoprotein D-like n=1 Tax=Symsagittifera roscoffensis TaxID=84072 RepID=UPI00307B8BE2